MNIKLIGSAVLLVLVVAGVWYFTSAKDAALTTLEPAVETGTESAVVPGNYMIDSAKSTFTWAAKKPLIPDYVNSGTLAIKEGLITAESASATGSFVIDMDTLHVGLTAKKPGKESALEAHLKGDDFFDVTKYPTSTFVITSVTPMPEISSTIYMYKIVGNLTMKGVTNEINFPAKIYLKDGALHAEASFAIDRTKWKITYGSTNFFKSLGDNFIDDMVELAFNIVATPTAPVTTTAEGSASSTL